MTYYALVPAAGSGSRMGESGPKQYLPLAGQPMIRHALATLCATPAVARVFVVLAPGDAHWPAAEMAGLGSKLGVLRCGGETRAQSVANGLRAMAGELGAIDHDWVLVHDAARPGLDDEALLRLRDALAGESSGGGLLAWPVSDTVKRAGDGDSVAATLSREGLWLAQTPQMFRRALLQAALARHPQVTDEAGAVEAEGRPVRLVQGSLTNFKVTTGDDLALMRCLLLAGDKR